MLEVLLFLLPSKVVLLLLASEMTLASLTALLVEGLVVGAGDEDKLDPSRSNVLFVELGLGVTRFISIFEHGDCLACGFAIGVRANLDSVLVEAVSVEELDDLFD